MKVLTLLLTKMQVRLKEHLSGMFVDEYVDKFFIFIFL